MTATEQDGSSAVTRAAAGALEGLEATAAMSGVMYAARRAGWLGRPPPVAITKRALHALGAHGAARRDAAPLGWVAHFAFGAVSGALYATPARGARSWTRAAVEGAAFGAGVWLVSYAGWIPAFSLQRPPHRDRPGRPTAMVVSHLVFGAVLGVLGERRRRGESRDRVPELEFAI